MVINRLKIAIFHCGFVYSRWAKINGLVKSLIKLFSPSGFSLMVNYNIVFNREFLRAFSPYELQSGPTIFLGALTRSLAGIAARNMRGEETGV